MPPPDSVDPELADASHTDSGDAEPTPTDRRRVWIVVATVSALALGAAWWATAKHETPPPTAGINKSIPRPVSIASVRKGSIPLLSEYRGELNTDVTELAAQSTGRLVSIAVNLGDTFEKGDQLARIDAAETSRLLGEAIAQSQAAEAQKARATAQLQTAQVEAERGERLVRESLLSAQQLNALSSQVRVVQAELAAAEAQRSAAQARVALYREQLGQASLQAPFDGAVAHRYLDPGAMVQAGTPVLRLVRSGPLEVRFRASEIHFSRLTPGIELQVTTLGTGSKVFRGQVSRVSAEVSRTDRSVEVEGVLDEVHPELRPGMYATVIVNLGRLPGSSILPNEALISKMAEDGSTEQGVYWIDGDRARYREVEVLGQHGDEVAVSGIEPGKRVVSHGQELLSDGTQVRLVDEKVP